MLEKFILIALAALSIYFIIKISLKNAKKNTCSSCPFNNNCDEKKPGT